MTDRLRVDPDAPEPEVVRRAAAFVRAGGLVVVPTETVYGLAARAADAAAVGRVYRVKQRDPAKPLPLQVASISDAAGVCVIPERYGAVLADLWPGPLTAVLHARGRSGSVGLRIPAHEVPLALLRELGEPLAVTSANRSGRPPCRSARAAAEALGDGVDCVLDAGSVATGAPSTVLDLTGDLPVLLRTGSLARSTLEAAFGCRILQGPESDG